MVLKVLNLQFCVLRYSGHRLAISVCLFGAGVCVRGGGTPLEEDEGEAFSCESDVSMPGPFITIEWPSSTARVRRPVSQRRLLV